MHIWNTLFVNTQCTCRVLMGQEDLDSFAQLVCI